MLVLSLCFHILAPDVLFLMPCIHVPRNLGVILIIFHENTMATMQNPNTMPSVTLHAQIHYGNLR